ncbi:hypothetical protein Tco_0705565, partial [Tanacetum coccineum]
MFLNMDQLEKQLDNEEFQEIGSMVVFKVLETQFQMFINSQIYLDDEYVVMTRNYFLQYTLLEIPEFHDTLIQHMKSVKKSIDKRALHKRETESKEQDTSSISGNDANADDANIRPIYDEEPMAEFAKSSILGKPVLQPHRNQSVVRQPTAFKSERPRISKPRLASKVDVNNDLSKPVTIHYLPKEKESVVAKPHHMIAPGLPRWVPTGKIFTSSTTKVDSEPINGSNDDITNQYKCEQTLNVSVVTLNLSAELGIHDHNSEPSNSKLVPKVVPPADRTSTSQQDLELQFSPI